MRSQIETASFKEAMQRKKDAAYAKAVDIPLTANRSRRLTHLYQQCGHHDVAKRRHRQRCATEPPKKKKISKKGKQKKKAANTHSVARRSSYLFGTGTKLKLPEHIERPIARAQIDRLEAGGREGGRASQLKPMTSSVSRRAMHEVRGR
jgi:hypothetical protein